jgi:hypothetical protein
MKSPLIAAAALLLAFGNSTAALGSCGSAFCTINTNWDAHGAWSPPGLRLDLRYERLDQNQPMSGSKKVAVGAVPEDHDEVRTANRNWLATVDYTFNSDWGVSVALPIVDRDHLHLANDFDAGTQMPESWNFRQVGDARVMARYRVATVEGDDHTIGTVGVNFGLKLPTGRTGVANGDGEQAERSLQPGTGSTDALIGAYYAQLLPLKDLSWFAQALVQLPLDQSGGYKPGGRIGLDAGLRYELSDRLSLMLQLNALYRGRDSGANAERENSGGRSWYLGPGLSFSVTDDVRLYGFVQAPVYQYVNGVQLATRPAVVLGLSAKF